MPYDVIMFCFCSGLPMSCKNSLQTSQNNFIAPAESCSLREANSGDHLKGRKSGGNAKAIATLSVGDNICQITSFDKVNNLFNNDFHYWLHAIQHWCLFNVILKETSFIFCYTRLISFER